jgi:hypothetical protein
MPKDNSHIERHIEDWVWWNYGQSEVDNPSWDIKSLARYLVNCHELAPMEERYGRNRKA